MKSTNKFGDHLTLQATALAYDLPILVLDSTGLRNILLSNNRVSQSNFEEPLLLGLYPEGHGEHYVSVQADVSTIQDLCVSTVPGSSITRTSIRSQSTVHVHVHADGKTSESIATSASVEYPDRLTNTQSKPLVSGPQVQSTVSIESPPESCDNVDESSFWPVCWSREQYLYFKTANDWLFFSDGKLGCCHCREIWNSGSCDDSSCKVGVVSAEWASGIVAPYGSSRASQQTSLRKKILYHKTSASHIEAVKVMKEKKSQTFEKACSKQCEKQNTETCRIFRTAYYIAANDRPYTDHSELIMLQEINGLDMGRILHDRKICADIIDHVAVEMRSKIVSGIMKTGYPLAVLIDESTSNANVSCLIVYVRATVDITIGPITIFLDILELPATDAEAITQALLNCLHLTGFTMNYLQEHWLALGTDGASVMLGSKSGVATRLKAKFPLLVRWHCFNHRLELSVSDAVKSCSEVNHFKSFVDSLYAVYNPSPKLQRELSFIAADLDVQLRKLGRVLDTRWVASSCRTVKSVWDAYAALHTHFTAKASDSALDWKQKSKFSGMAKKLESSTFILNLGLMLDALEELSDLSLALQKSDVTVSKANKLIKRQIEIFSCRKCNDAYFYKEACDGVQEGKFKSVCVRKSCPKEKMISRDQFYQALSDSMASRLLHESDKFLMSAAWALDKDAVTSGQSPGVGEDIVRDACVKLGLEFSHIKNEYRDFVESRGLIVGPNLLKLTHYIGTVPVSTASCERGFSRMNVISNNLRSRLTVKHLSSLMFISLTGPPLSSWQPLPYVKSWLLKNRREASCTIGRSKDIKLPVNEKELESLWKTLDS